MRWKKKTRDKKEILVQMSSYCIVLKMKKKIYSAIKQNAGTLSLCIPKGSWPHPYDPLLADRTL